MIRNLFMMFVITLTSLFGLTACGADSKPTVTVTVPSKVTASPTRSVTTIEEIVGDPIPDSYEQRIAWGTSPERQQLVKQLQAAAIEISEAAAHATSEFEDDGYSAAYTSESGGILTCTGRTWSPAASPWTYITDVCIDADGSVIKASYPDVHVIHDDHTSVAVADLFEANDETGVRYSHVSANGLSSTCYLVECATGPSGTSTIKVMAAIEMKAARLLTQAATELPQG